MPMTSQDPSNLIPQTGQTQDPLAQLQDIHLPPEIGLWPPAWGWWLLAVILVCIVFVLFFIIKRNRSRNNYRGLAIAELNALNQKYTDEQNPEYLQALSIILRRTALSGFGNQFNASLKGNDWLEWLDSQCARAKQQFSQGIGTVLLVGPYQKSPEFNRAELHKLSVVWIKEHRNQWQRSNKVVTANKAATEKEAKNHV
jgi:hypothetical protein